MRSFDLLLCGSMVVLSKLPMSATVMVARDFYSSPGPLLLAGQRGRAPVGFWKATPFPAFLCPSILRTNATCTEV